MDKSYIPSEYLINKSLNIQRQQRYIQRDQAKFEQERSEFIASSSISNDTTLPTPPEIPDHHVSQETQTSLDIPALLESSQILLHQNLELKAEVAMLREENSKLNKELSSTKKKLEKITWGVQKIEDPKKCRFWTGFTSLQVFMWVFNLVVPYVTQNFASISKLNQMLLVFVRIRQGSSVGDVADKFDIDPSVASRVCSFWIPVLRARLSSLIKWHSKESILKNLPRSFKAKSFRKTRAIIDCFEIFIQRPTNLRIRSLTYSNYKHHNTLKCLIAICPNGNITFLSKCHGGRASDKSITLESGFLKMLEAGDLVLADKGFLIECEVAAVGATLRIPDFLKDRKQLSAKSVRRTRNIANRRIHVERAIGRLKQFRILQQVVPIATIDKMDDILVICSALVNLQPPVVLS